MQGFPGGASGKELTCQCRRHIRLRFDPWVGKIPWRRKCQPTSILAWRIPWTEEPAGLPSKGSQIVGQNWSDLTPHTRLSNLPKVTARHWKKWVYNSSLLIVNEVLFLLDKRLLICSTSGNWLTGSVSQVSRSSRILKLSLGLASEIIIIISLPWTRVDRSDMLASH